MTFSASYAAHVKTIDQKQTFKDDHPSPCNGRDNRFEFLSRTMKLTSILLLIACLQVNATGFGQGTVTISVKNVAVTEVFKEIEKQTPFRFLYRDELVKKAGLVTLSVRDASVQDVLNRCFDKKPLDYKIFRETIVISEKSSVGTGMIDAAETTIDVTGRVLNEQGKPVEGVTVTIKNSDKSTITNANGEFFLSSVDQDAVLVFTSVNMETFELKVSGKTELLVSLKAKVSELGNVEVVHTGYQDVPRERATGSYVKVDNELLNRRVSTDILSRLEGVTSGLLFDNNAENQIGISIRGRSTIFGNTQPLIILDNFPFQGDIGEINPNDIENITILKDAAAASIWGAFSGNGVIVITTKKGKANQSLNVGVNANLTIVDRPDLFYDQQALKSVDFIEVENFLFSNGHYDGDLYDPTYPVVSPVVEVLENLRQGNITQSQADQQIKLLKQYDIRNDYSKYFYRKAFNQQYAVNMSGGGNKTAYYFSVGYDDNLASLKQTNNDRITVNSQFSFKPIEQLEITGGINFVQGSTTNNGLASITAGGKYSRIYPYARLADEQGNPLSVQKNYRTSFVENTGINGLLDWSYVPLKEMELNDAESKNTSNRISAAIKYKVFRGLSIEASYFLQKSITSSENFHDAESYYARSLINMFSDVQGSDVFARNIPLGAIVARGQSELTSHSGRGQLMYSNSFNRHFVSFLAGFEVREIKVEGRTETNFGYDPNLGTSIPVDFKTQFFLYPTFANTQIQGAPTITPYTLDRFRSYFGNASYTYDGKYTVFASARLDQSNLFGVETNQKGVPLWSVGTKWDIDKEEFYKIGWVNALKLRISYGYNGNIDNSITAITTAQYYPTNLNNVAFAQVALPGNSQLRWEKIGLLNVGLDFEMFKSRIGGSIEYYRRSGKDLLGDALVASSTGFLTVRGNYSSMQGSGIDITLNSSVISRKSFKWYVDILVSRTTDKITKNEGTLKVVGRPVNSVLVYRWGGLDPTTGDPIGFVDGHESVDYSTIISAASANPSLYLYAGRLSPEYFGGMRNTIQWKSISLSANITFKAGYRFIRSSLSYSTLFSTGVGHSEYASRWAKPGDENETSVPSMIYPADPNRDLFYSGAEINVEKGDHIRLQDINLTYSINRGGRIKIPFQQIQTYIYVSNLGLLWKSNDKGIDPDFQQGFPNPRRYSFGIRLTL